MDETKDILFNALAANQEIILAFNYENLFNQLGFRLSDPKNRSSAVWLLGGDSLEQAMKCNGFTTALRAAPLLPVDVDEAAVREAAERQAMQCLIVNKSLPLIVPLEIPVEIDRNLFSDSDSNQIDYMISMWIDAFDRGLRQIRERPQHRYVQ